MRSLFTPSRDSSLATMVSRPSCRRSAFSVYFSMQDHALVSSPARTYESPGPACAPFIYLCSSLHANALTSLSYLGGAKIISSNHYLSSYLWETRTAVHFARCANNWRISDYLVSLRLLAVTLAIFILVGRGWSQIIH